MGKTEPGSWDHEFWGKGCNTQSIKFLGRLN